MSTVPELLMQKLKTQKLATVTEGVRNMAGDIKLKDVQEIAQAKGQNIKSILGTCLSCGVTVEGRSPKEVIKDVEQGIIKAE